MIGPLVEGLEVGQSYKLIVPQKLRLGGTVEGKSKPGLFRVFVPSRDGGLLTLESSAGQLDVIGPDGQPVVDAATGKGVAPAKKVSFEVGQGQFGWFGVMVTGAASYEVSAKFTITGHAKDRDGKMLVPWNFYYFPFTGVGPGHPAENWDKEFRTKAFEFESASFFKSEIESGGRRRGGLDGHTINQEFLDAYNKFLGKEDGLTLGDCGWWGHCDAAAAASAIFTQPKAKGGLAEQDVEWAASEIAMRGYALDLKFFLGGVGNNSRSHPSHLEIPEDKEGQSVDKDIGAFHEALVKLIKHEGGVAIMDFRADEGEGKHVEVWNQAAYKFESEVEQLEPDAIGKDEEALARRVKVKTIVFANADDDPSPGNPENPKGSGWDRELHYVLNYDKKGKVDAAHPRNNAQKCTWEATGKNYYLPRYIFKVKGLAGSQGNGNPHVTLNHLGSIGVRPRGLFGG